MVRRVLGVSLHRSIEALMRDLSLIDISSKVGGLSPRSVSHSASATYSDASRA